MLFPQASQFGTKQINEDGLLDLIRTLPAKVAKKAAPKKTAKQKSPTPFGVSEPLTPKSHPAPKSSVTTPTQSHVSTPVAMTTPKGSHVTTPVPTPTVGKLSVYAWLSTTMDNMTGKEMVVLIMMMIHIIIQVISHIWPWSGLIVAG